MSEEFLQLAERNGYAFKYDYNGQRPYARDEVALQTYSNIVLAHLQLQPYGLHCKQRVEKGLADAEQKLRRDFHSKIPLHLQAFYYCRLFQDVRARPPTKGHDMRSYVFHV